MKQLKDRILRDGQVLGNGILKVDSFINHQVDPALMDACGREFAKRFADVGATKILTAEISGIAPAHHHGLSSWAACCVCAQDKTDHHARSGLSHARAFAYKGTHGRVDRFTRISCQRRKSFDH